MKLMTTARRLRGDITLIAKFVVTALLLPLAGLKYLLDVGDKFLSPAMIEPRKPGTSPYDAMLVRHVYVPHTSLAMRALAAVEDEAETPPWKLREEKTDGRQVVDSAWVSAANVRAALEPQRSLIETAKLTSHGFLGALKAHGAYLAAEGRPTEEVVEDYRKTIEEQGVFVVEDEPKPQPEKRRVRRAKLAAANATA